MTTAIPESLLAPLSEFVAAHMGLNFPQDRWRNLERGISSASLDLGFQDAGECIRWLVSSALTKKQIEILASHLTIGETYFFRDKGSFDILENNILPELINSRRKETKRLRIWSAGCCTGEEPYSIAILINKMIPDLKDWNVTILATDINPRFLKKASEGLYSNWSFRATPDWLKNKYFEKTTNNGFEILPSIREMVTFSYLNLAEDIYPSLLNNTNAMDVIFCRNVLMYFAPEGARKVIQRLFQSVVDDGWLFVSPCEASSALSSQFHCVNFPGVHVYRKGKPLAGPDRDFKVPAPPPVFKPGVARRIEPPSGGFLPIPEIRPEKRPPRPPETAPKPKPEPPPKNHPLEEALGMYAQGRYAEVAEKLSGLYGASQFEGDEPGRAVKGLLLLARACANRGKLAEAQGWCERAIALDKLNPGAHYLLAIILQEQGQAEGTARSLKRALYLDPGFVLAHFALGNLAHQQGKPGESLRHFANARELLEGYPQGDILPESEGIAAGRLSEIIDRMGPRETGT